MSKNPSILLHIGMPKTATTSLQQFFYQNKKALKTLCNVHYGSSAGDKNHLKLAAYSAPDATRDLLEAKYTVDVGLRASFKKKFQNELNSNLKQGYDVLYSNEHLASRVSTPEHFELLKSLFEGIDYNVKIILYLRRQDKYMFSSYSTWIKSGGVGKFRIKGYKQKKFDYLKLLDRWSENFGKENLIVRPFERSMWPDGDIYKDFVQTIGVEWQAGFSPIEAQANKSLDRFQLAFLSKFNKRVDAFDGDKKNKLRGKIVQLLETQSSDDKIELSKDETQEILDYFAKANQQISEDYLHGETLFTSSLPKGDEVKVPQLTVDKAIDISAHLWIEQQKIINSKSIKKFFS